jgi:glycosyltransferase involved in cell wall biosynthesis
VVDTAPLVSVVIPAYNAEAYIATSLRGVTAQAYRNLEIIVVDDGSRDATATIVRSLAADDPRIKLQQQQNAGVAAARNRGIEASSGDLVAPLDADDLWQPSKIERQVAVMQRGSPKVGLVYAWFVQIDEAGMVTRLPRAKRRIYEGDVFRDLVARNFIGNGSSPLMRKECVLEAGGYDPELRRQQAQGCEDFKLYLAIAERWHFGAVPAFLVGYRQSPTSMSEDLAQMKRSRDLVMAEVRRRHPELPSSIFRVSNANGCFWLASKAKRARRPLAAASYLARMVASDPASLPVRVREFCTRRRARALGKPVRFEEYPVEPTMAGSAGGEPAASQWLVGQSVPKEPT